ncbi:hypothetical protein H4696_000234 [Amycolatopsis lexingtonensis]|uniref:MFS transporter n=1 Tax=Amycolatopsis lexingtonensis TaxID=218822 RepID=A0ABR9HQD2_9PSEU|nr:hypothetical protein [Amycolatopsis lexingtonensis]
MLARTFTWAQRPFALVSTTAMSQFIVYWL